MRYFYSLSFEHARRYLPDELEDLPPYSLGSVEKVFKVGVNGHSIAIDNQHGLGETPDGRNVLYKGCVAFMKLSNFHKLTNGTPADRHEVAKSMRDKVLDGYSIASPILWLDIDSYVDDTADPPFVTSHEGRARALLLESLGFTSFPINLIFEGFRARHVKHPKEFLEYLNDGIKSQLGVLQRGMFTKLEFA